jgi:cation:H+ antiporter
MNVVTAFVYLIIGFVLLIAGADFLVRGASSLARRMKVSALVIGMTIVSFGTSMPEVVVNIMAAVGKNSDLVFGNVIGSNIMNTVLILGVAGVITPIAVRRRTVIAEIPAAIISVMILALLLNDRIWGYRQGLLSRVDALFLLLGYLVFLIYAFRIRRTGVEEGQKTRVYAVSLTWVLIIAGFAGLLAGGRTIVVNAVKLAEYLGVSQKLIALTIVSIGTSLPELATTAVAAYRRKFDIAIGNVVGSNIFNIMLVLGLSGLVSPLGFDMALNVDLLVLFLGSAGLLIFMFSGRVHQLDRWEAAIFLAGYVSYLVFLFIRR